MRVGAFSSPVLRDVPAASRRPLLRTHGILDAVASTPLVPRSRAAASRGTAAGAHPLRHCEARSAAAIQVLRTERLPLGRFAPLAMMAKAVSGPVLRDGPPGLLSTNGSEAAAPTPLAVRSGVDEGQGASRRAASRSTAAGAHPTRHCEARSAAAIQGRGPERLPLDCFASLAMTAKKSTATVTAVYPIDHTRTPGRAGEAIRQRRDPCAICR
jgi:hypothetical protein